MLKNLDMALQSVRDSFPSDRAGVTTQHRSIREILVNETGAVSIVHTNDSDGDWQQTPWCIHLKKDKKDDD